MESEQLDDILIDGELIATCVGASSDLINFLNNSNSAEQEREVFVKSLGSIWKALIDYQSKYPGSDYVMKAKQQTLNYARSTLSSDLYDKVYGE